MINSNQIEARLDQVLQELHQLKHYQQKDLLDSEEAATFLGISLSTLYKHTSKGNLPFYKPSGKLIMFKRDDLRHWLQARRVPSNAELLKKEGGVE
ncbi:MAG: DNA-binding protein [Proteobacteria bacterium]|nr:MAG: DNA-binding protein [Pseudomonadota bacterium]